MTNWGTDQAPPASLHCTLHPGMAGDLSVARWRGAEYTSVHLQGPLIYLGEMEPSYPESTEFQDKCGIHAGHLNSCPVIHFPFHQLPPLPFTNF